MQRKIKVLYLEDDILDVDLVQAKLATEKALVFDLKVATSRTEYEKLLHDDTFDIILSDYNLPSYTGLEALKYLKKVQASTPFILLSGAVGDEIAVEIMRLGAFDYVLKNQLEKLNIVIKRALKAALEKAEKLQWESMFHTIEKAALAGFFKLDINGNYIYTNDFFLKILSCTRQEVMHKECFTVLSYLSMTKMQDDWKVVVQSKGVYKKLCQIITPDGHKKWVNLHILPEVRGKKHTGYVGVLFDITEIKETESELEHIKKYDQVTLLLNKDAFQESLESFLAEHQNRPPVAALLFSNIDNFRRISEFFGHEESGKILKEIATRLKSHYQGAIVARFDNDTFSILLLNIERASVITNLIDTFNLDLVDNAITVHGKPISLSLTTGIVGTVKSHDTVSQLLQHAAQTLHQAQEDQKGSYCFYSKTIEKKSTRRAEIEHALKYGMAHNELCLVYQPQIDIEQHKIVGVEALCRWSSKTLGDMSPGEFIPLAESTGLIQQLSEYLCIRFFYDMEGWLLKNPALFHEIKASFNLSASVISNEAFFDHIISGIKKFNLTPDSICFEITETAIMQNPAGAGSLMHKLSKTGFSLSVDDFGTGQSSLSYLKSLPVDELKIDGSFIKNIDVLGSDYEIVKATIGLATKLNLSVIAECVEKMEQVEVLRQLNCHVVQGFYYSKPLTVQALTEFIKYFSKGDKT